MENPPDKFDFDLSTNICMVLAKKNNLNPVDLSQKIKKLIKKFTGF